MYRVFEKSEVGDVAQLATWPLTGIWLTAIVNPFGPTLKAIGIVGEPAANSARPLIYLSLNPFQQECLVIGQWIGGSEVDLAEGAEALTPVLQGSCPTLLIFHDSLHSISNSLATTLLAKCDGYETTRDAVCAHLGDPWTRVGLELQRTSFTKSTISRDEFSKLLLGLNHIDPEIKALFFAWGGAIDFQRASNPGLANSAMSRDMFAVIYRQLTRSSQCSPEEPPAPINPPAVKEILLDDLTRFISDAAYRRTIDRGTAVHMLERLFIAQGREGERQYASIFAGLYVEYVALLSVSAREGLLSRLISQVESGATGPGAINTFLFGEPDRAVASAAALGICVLTDADVRFVSQGLRFILETWRGENVANRGAVLGGVLLLGDARFLRHLVEPRKAMSLAEVNELARCQSSFMMSCTIDFYLDWAEELVDRRDHDGLAKFGAVMSALVLVTRADPTSDVFKVERSVPVMSEPEPIKILNRWTRAEFATRIAGRLYELEAREDEPKLAPAVRQAWGIQGKVGVLQRLTSMIVPSKGKH